MSRFIGSIQLDDRVNSYFVERVIPSTRDVQRDQIVNRRGRLTRVREDNSPLIVSVRGVWIDAGGKYWRDFKAALLAQSRVHFTLGDGTQYEMVDVDSIAETRLGGIGGSATPTERWGYVASVASYEPFAREVSPALQSLGALVSGTNTYTVNYAGTAPAEATWQIQLTASSLALTGITIANSATGESCTFANDGSFGTLAGAVTILVDAAGTTSSYPATSATPGNNHYGLLAVPSTGYGVSADLSGSGHATDHDFTGLPPTLTPNPSPTIPPTAYGNTITVTVSSSAGSFTAGTLKMLAPARYIR